MTSPKAIATIRPAGVMTRREEVISIVLRHVSG